MLKVANCNMFPIGVLVCVMLNIYVTLCLKTFLENIYKDCMHNRDSKVHDSIIPTSRRVFSQMNVLISHACVFKKSC